MRKRPLALAACLLLLLATAAAGWNTAGHMVSGAIAYQVLKADHPDTLAKVTGLLREHPDFEARWKNRLEADYVDAEERDLYLFMLAARWADDARDDRRFYPPDQQRDRWHYINLPIRVNGPAATPPDPNNILRGYAVNAAMVKNAGAATADRAVALTWVFHLVGDVHQPLHVATLFSVDYPTGDRGGNRFYVRARENSSVITLHQFWDDLIIGSGRFQDTRNRAVELRLRPEFERTKLKELGVNGFENWAKEGFPVALKHAYKDGHLQGSTTRTEAPILPEEYIKNAKAVGERRIVLAGYRLAAVLHDLMR